MPVGRCRSTPNRWMLVGISPSSLRITLHKEIDRVDALWVFNKGRDAELLVDLAFQAVHKRAQVEVSLLVNEANGLRARFGEAGASL
jgi:hypothetical protein